MSKEPRPKNPGDGEIVEARSAMKTFELLFDSRMRDYERRILSLEDRLTKETYSLREEIMKRIDGLETFCKEKLDTKQRSDAEKAKRTEAGKETPHFNPFRRQS